MYCMQMCSLFKKTTKLAKETSIFEEFLLPESSPERGSFKVIADGNLEDI